MKRLDEKSGFLSRFAQAIRNIWLDSRIPSRDKWVIAASIFLIISPFDLLPDFIPVIGFVDDLVLLTFILDYFFNRLDENIVLDHISSIHHDKFKSAKKIIVKICNLIPQHVLHFLWKYKETEKQPEESLKNVN